MSATTAIAQHLNVTESAIIEVQEWARVLWVRVKGLGARFVSKKVKQVSNIEIKEVEGGYQSFWLCPKINPWTKKEYLQVTQTRFGFRVWEDKQTAIDVAQAAYDNWVAQQQPKRQIDSEQRDRAFAIGMGMHQAQSGEWIDEDEYDRLQEMGIDP